MDQRRNQLRQAKQRQRERDREAGLVLYQTKLPLHLARRLKAGLNNPEFRERFNRFFHGMLDEGVYLAPSAYEAGFVSSVHSQEN